MRPRPMQCLLGAAAALALTACGGPLVAPPPPIDVATPAMVAMKAAAGVADCPAGATANGGLPKQTLPCLGGGRTVDLSTLRGPLMINVFQAGCTPCRLEMPALEAFYRHHGTKVPVIGLDSTDFLAGKALQEAISRGVTYPLIADPDSTLQGTSMTVRGFPTFFFLSADGKLTSEAGGKTNEAQIVSMVEQELGVQL